MTSLTSSTTPGIVEKAKQAALNRWKIEALTGLMGYRALQHHQAESQRNMAAENRHVRTNVWGETPEQAEQPAGEDMGGHTILGDSITTHPTPLVISQGSDSGVGKLLAGAAIAAAVIGIPGAGIAGYFASKLADKPAATAPAPQSTTDDSLDIGLGRFSDLTE